MVKIKNLCSKIFAFGLIFNLFLSGCTSKRAELGSEQNPIKLFFVPSVDAKLLDDKSKIIKTLLEKYTPYKFSVAVPASFIAVVEAFGTKRADVASLNTYGYLLAHDKYGAEALLTIIRFGQTEYRAQILARADSPIKSLADLQGKKFAFVDSASTSGYLLPLKLLNEQGIKPSETVFAQKHDNVVSMIYQKQVDAGATYYSPPENGEIQDARRLVKSQYPDVEDKIKIIKLTDSIPNDPIVFRQDLPRDMKEKIVDGILRLTQDPEGRDAFFKIYGVTSFKKCSDSDYDRVRKMLSELGKNAAELMKK